MASAWPSNAFEPRPAYKLNSSDSSCCLLLVSCFSKLGSLFTAGVKPADRRASRSWRSALNRRANVALAFSTAARARTWDSSRHDKKSWMTMPTHWMRPSWMTHFVTTWFGANGIEDPSPRALGERRAACPARGVGAGAVGGSAANAVGMNAMP